MNPHKALNSLLDKGGYLASDRTFYRILKRNNALAHRSESKGGSSKHNPYIESFFKSVKHICGYPSCFRTIDGARRWFADFIDWYNNSHLHSGLQFVTPAQKRSGQYISIFTERNKIINEAKSAQRARWATCSTLQRTPPPLCLSAYTRANLF